MKVSAMRFGNRFADKKVIVTGGATGIGRAVVSRLAAEGATVLAVDVNEAGLAECVAIANASAGYGGSAGQAIASVSSERDVKRVVADFVAAQARLDSLINLAGILRATRTTETTLEQFMQVINVNLVGTFLCCREALPHLIQSRGSIVNAASTSSFFGHPYMAAYASSKGGVAALTHTLAWEYLKQGVRVNAVAPGGIQTPMTAAMATGFPPEPDMSLFLHLARPDQQWGQPEDVAGVIAMLASDDGRHINGEIVRIDGGVHS